MSQTSQDENFNNNQLEDIVLMYQQIIITQMWREMKDSEGELKMMNIWSLFKYIYSCTKLKKPQIQACLSDNELSNFACPGQVLVYLFWIPN